MPLAMRTQAHGEMHQAEGSVQDLYGQAKDAAGEAVGQPGLSEFLCEAG